MAKKEKTIFVRQVKSTIGRSEKHIASLKGLGLRKIGHTVELKDTPENRGMINAVHYLVELVEV